MSNEWDLSYNPGTDAEVTAMREQQRLEQIQWQIRREEQRIARGYIEVPYISNEDLMNNFQRWRNNSEQENWDNNHMATWSANRTIWICHNCGCFGFKYTLRELFKCYGCRSRNVTVCRAGEMSILIRNTVSDQQPGVNMQNIYQARRNRITIARRNSRVVQPE